MTRQLPCCLLSMPGCLHQKNGVREIELHLGRPVSRQEGSSDAGIHEHEVCVQRGVQARLHTRTNTASSLVSIRGAIFELARACWTAWHARGGFFMLCCINTPLLAPNRRCPNQSTCILSTNAWTPGCCTPDDVPCSILPCAPLQRVALVTLHD
jgi:hypothetical protein